MNGVRSCRRGVPFMTSTPTSGGDAGRAGRRSTCRAHEEAGAMARELTRPAQVSAEEFDRLFEAVTNWGRWGLDDELGTLNYVTADKVRAAAALVRSGRSVSMAIPINKEAGPDNPNPAVHFIAMGHDVQVGGGESFGMCFLGMMSHGDCHTHVDALNHVAYRGKLYNGKDALATLTSQGSAWGSIAAYAQGILGRGVLLDAARHRGVPWLEPGEAVGRAELEAIEAAEGVALGEGDFFVFRTGHHARRLRSAPGITGAAGRRGQGWPRPRRHLLPARAQGRRLSARRRRRDHAGWRDGDPVPGARATAHCDGDAALRTAPVRGAGEVCEEEGRWEFMVVGLPLRFARRHGLALEPDRPIRRHSNDARVEASPTEKLFVGRPGHWPREWHRPRRHHLPDGAMLTPAAS